MTKLNKEITFLSAGENKTLEFTISNRKECVIAKTVQEVAEILSNNYMHYKGNTFSKDSALVKVNKLIEGRA